MKPKQNAVALRMNTHKHTNHGVQRNTSMILPQGTLIYNCV